MISYEVLIAAIQKCIIYDTESEDFSRYSAELPFFDSTNIPWSITESGSGEKYEEHGDKPATVTELQSLTGRFDPTLVDSFDQDESPDPDLSRRYSMKQFTPALQLRQYHVSLIRGLSTREVQLVVSPEGIRVDPVPCVRRPKLFSKPIVLGLQLLADCEVNTARSSRSSSSLDPPVSPSPSSGACLTGKVLLSIIHLAQDTDLATSTSFDQSDAPGPVFQNLCFETQLVRARTIRDQIWLILQCFASRARSLYMQRRLAN